MKIPKGFMLVPVKPTTEMIEAGKKACEYPRQLHALRNPQIIFEAMVKVAPKDDAMNIEDLHNLNGPPEVAASEFNDLLSAAVDRLEQSRHTPIPWDHKVYEQRDGLSPMMKFNADCFRVAMHYLDSR